MTNDKRTKAWMDGDCANVPEPPKTGTFICDWSDIPEAPKRFEVRFAFQAQTWFDDYEKAQLAAYQYEGIVAKEVKDRAAASAASHDAQEKAPIESAWFDLHGDEHGLARSRMNGPYYDMFRRGFIAARDSDMSLACNVKLRWARALGFETEVPPSTWHLEQLTEKKLAEAAERVAAVRSAWNSEDGRGMETALADLERGFAKRDEDRETEDEELTYVTETPVDLDASCEETAMRRLSKGGATAIAKRMRRSAKKVNR